MLITDIININAYFENYIHSGFFVLSYRGFHSFPVRQSSNRYGKKITSVNYETDGLNTCRVRSILKTQTAMTAWDAKHVNLFSDHEVTLVYERAKIACVLIQVDMKTIEIAYWSQ